MISNGECSKLHEDLFKARILNTTLCTFEHARIFPEYTVYGTAKGDSGGPLVVNNQLVGICSWGNIRFYQTYPDQYTRLSEYAHWIEENTGIKAI